MIAVRTASGRQAVGLVKARNAGGALKSAARVSVRNAAGVLKLAWSALTASLNVPAVTGYGDSTGGISITTNSVTATPNGGTGPFSHSWAQASGDPATINSPTSATTSFTFAGVGPGSASTGTFVCTITDANGSVAASPAVSATATNVNTA